MLFYDSVTGSERALLSVVQQAYVEGVSTRRVEDLIRTLGCEGISKSQVSRICAELDTAVDAFLSRPLDGGPYPYVWLDALTQKVREDGRIVNVSVVIATGVEVPASQRIAGLLAPVVEATFANHPLSLLPLGLVSPQALAVLVAECPAGVVGGVAIAHRLHGGVVGGEQPTRIKAAQVHIAVRGGT